MSERFPNSARLIAAVALTLALASALLADAPNATSAKKQRIVALTPFAANTLVGVGVKPVAIGQMAVGDKGLSPKLKGVKRLTLSHPNGPNMEQIATIDPDVVLTSQEWRKGSQTMRDLAITVREVDPAKALEVPSKQRAVGYAYGSRARTNRLVRSSSAEIAYAMKGSKKNPHPIKQHPNVLMVLGVGRTPYVFINNSWGGSVARAAGAKLLGGDLKGSGGFAKVSDEYVVQQNPDIILAVPHGNAKDVPSIADFLKNNPAWSTVNAIKNNRVYVTMDDALLQANVDVGDTIKRLRVEYLKNW